MIMVPFSSTNDNEDDEVYHFVSKVMNFALKMINFVLKMMNFGRTRAKRALMTARCGCKVRVLLDFQ